MGHRFASLGLAAAALVLISAAEIPRALASTSPGLWEISGPGPTELVRRCVANTAALALVEHRGQPCSSTLISDRGPSALIHYSCRGGGFGQSRLTVITPRSLRIETQGIADGVPFNYSVQARRAGQCER